jgi:hypothetical protein
VQDGQQIHCRNQYSLKDWANRRELSSTPVTEPFLLTGAAPTDLERSKRIFLVAPAEQTLSLEELDMKENSWFLGSPRKGLMHFIIS